MTWWEERTLGEMLDDAEARKQADAAPRPGPSAPLEICDIHNEANKKALAEADRERRLREPVALPSIPGHQHRLGYLNELLCGCQWPTGADAAPRPGPSAGESKQCEFCQQPDTDPPSMLDVCADCWNRANEGSGWMQRALKAEAELKVLADPPVAAQMTVNIPLFFWPPTSRWARVTRRYREWRR